MRSKNINKVYRLMNKYNLMILYVNDNVDNRNRWSIILVTRTF